MNKKIIILMILIIIVSLIAWKIYKYNNAQLGVLIGIYGLIIPFGYKVVKSMKILDPFDPDE